MGERHGALKLIEARKHLHKHLLREVLLGHTARQMGTHDPDDERVELVHELPSGRLVELPHAGQTGIDVKRALFRHRGMGRASYTKLKTLGAWAGYALNGV